MYMYVNMNIFRQLTRYRTLTLWDDFFERNMADNVKMFGLPVPNEGRFKDF